MPIAEECLKCSDCGGHIVKCEICLEPIKKGDLIECSDKIETKDCRHAHKQCFDDKYQITKNRNKKEVENEEDSIS
ncbi:hypothetical protein KAU43_05015 [candidate division WOR-3 bacterium]|nr:hypothetical protein [candidate division WOR-3 bacterium]